ncbi:MAG: glycosyltransferase [Bacteroidota bacterium]
MRVLEVLYKYPGETFIRQHAAALNEHAADTELVWAYTQTPYSGRKKNWDFGRVTCYALPNYNQMGPWKQWLSSILYPGNQFVKLYTPQLALLKKLNPDIVHFQFASLAIQYSHLCVKLNIPYTFSVRGSDINISPLTVPNYIPQLKETATHAAGIHCVSQDLKDRLDTITSQNNNAQVIRTTISNSWARVKRSPVKGLLLTVGRLQWMKGYTDLILALSYLKKDGIPFHLQIVGDGPQEQELEYMIRDLSLNDEITLYGRKSQQEIKQLMEKADAFVCSSVAEGFPNVVAEAMLAGLPVIATDCNGISEVLNESNSTLCESGDPFSLYQALKKHLSAPANDKANAAFKTASALFNDQLHAGQFSAFWHQQVNHAV